MRNPSSLSIPQSRQITNQINRLVDLNQLQLNNHPHNLIDSPASRDESVEAKWEQIQYYEAKENHSLSSIASSSNSNSTSSTSNSSSNAKLKSRLKKLKQNSLKKLQSFKLWTKNGKQKTTEGEPNLGNNEVNSQPNGTTTDPNAGSYSMSTKLRASKSMQNLEQLTRDSFYNLKDISNNLKQRYNSRMELRQQSQMYNELWDSEDDDGSETDQDYYHRSHRSYDY